MHRIRYSRLRLLALAYSRSPCDQRDHGTTGSRVPYKSQHDVHAPYTPGTARPAARHAAGLIPRHAGSLGSGAISEPFDASSAGSLSLISIVIASQFPPESFHRLIDDPTAADAICDRITAGALVVSLTGESMRRLKNQVKG